MFELDDLSASQKRNCHLSFVLGSNFNLIKEEHKLYFPSYNIYYNIFLDRLRVYAITVNAVGIPRQNRHTALHKHTHSPKTRTHTSSFHL